MLLFEASCNGFTAVSEFVAGKNEGDIFICDVTPDNGSVRPFEISPCRLPGCRSAKEQQKKNRK
jgi:hypothetical protein